MTKGRGADVNTAHGEAISGQSVGEGLRYGEAEAFRSKDSCFGLVEGEIVASKGVAEVIKCRRDTMAMGWWGNKAEVVNNGGPDEVGMLDAMQFEYAGKRAHEKKRAEGITLCNSFM